MEKPNIKRLRKAFRDVQTDMDICIRMDNDGADLKDIAEKALFALNRATVILNDFILFEET